MTAPAIVLSHTQMGENIGSAARAMNNFGLGELVLIAPKCEWPNDRAQMLASGSSEILNRARVCATAEEALAPYNLVLATTARARDIVKDIHTPQAAAARIRTAASTGAKTAILFGNERAGLDNDELSLADAVITIPTAEFWSLNLGQAVLLLAYEWFKSADTTAPVRVRDHIGVPATRGELVGLFEHLERELDAAQFFFPPAKKDAMVRNIRAMILNSRLTDQQARTIRGMIVALVRNKYRGEKS
jgi:tRNA/rRNA methyltransferase